MPQSRRIALVAAAALLAAACRPQPSEPAGEAPPPPPAVAGDPAPTPAARPPAQPFYAGRWAARPELCRESAWIITRETLTTPGHVVCRFENAPQGPGPGPGPVQADATCTAEGPPAQWRIRFAYAQSAGALLVEGGPFSDVGLVRCPDDGAAPAEGGG